MPELRVEMVTPTLHMGGMERLVVRMAHAFRERGLDAGITCIEDTGALAEEARDLNIPVALVPTPGLVTNLLAPRLSAHFARRRLHVVHAHSGVWLKAARAARAAGVPGVVHTFHGIVEDEPWYIRQQRRAASWCTSDIVAVSESLRTILIEQSGIPGDRIDVIINGVDVNRFAPGARAPHAGDQERFIVGHVARLDPIKNQSMLLRAFGLARRELPSARLVVAGDGPARAGLKALAADLDIAAVVDFLGEVRDTSDLYRGFDLFALSSVSEGTSMSILEAMASGVPVIATAVGGTPALVQQGTLATLVPSQDVEAMAAAIVGLARDIERRRAVAATAREFVVANYSEQAMLERYHALYRRHVTEVAA